MSRIGTGTGLRQPAGTRVRVQPLAAPSVAVPRSDTGAFAALIGSSIQFANTVKRVTDDREHDQRIREQRAELQSEETERIQEDAGRNRANAIAPSSTMRFHNLPTTTPNLLRTIDPEDPEQIDQFVLGMFGQEIEQISDDPEDPARVAFTEELLANHRRDAINAINAVFQQDQAIARGEVSTSVQNDPARADTAVTDLMAIGVAEPDARALVQGALQSGARAVAEAGGTPEQLSEFTSRMTQADEIAVLESQAKSRRRQIRNEQLSTLSTALDARGVIGEYNEARELAIAARDQGLLTDDELTVAAAKIDAAEAKSQVVRQSTNISDERRIANQFNQSLAVDAVLAGEPVDAALGAAGNQVEGDLVTTLMSDGSEIESSQRDMIATGLNRRLQELLGTIGQGRPESIPGLVTRLARAATDSGISSLPQVNTMIVGTANRVRQNRSVSAEDRTAFEVYRAILSDGNTGFLDSLPAEDAMFLEWAWLNNRYAGLPDDQAMLAAVLPENAKPNLDEDQYNQALEDSGIFTFDRPGIFGTILSMPFTSTETTVLGLGNSVGIGTSIREQVVALNNTVYGDDVRRLAEFYTMTGMDSGTAGKAAIERVTANDQMRRLDNLLINTSFIADDKKRDTPALRKFLGQGKTQAYRLALMESASLETDTQSKIQAAKTIRELDAINKARRLLSTIDSRFNPVHVKFSDLEFMNRDSQGSVFGLKVRSTGIDIGEGLLINLFDPDAGAAFERAQRLRDDAPKRTTSPVVGRRGPRPGDG